MENQEKFNEIAYKKARRRVKEITNFYWFLIGYGIVAAVLLSRDYDNNVFNFSQDYINLMLILQGIFLLAYGIYLFVPALHNWEENKTKQLMKNTKKMDEQVRYQQAKKRVKQVKGFYVHATVFVLVNLFIIALKYLKYGDDVNYSFIGMGFWGLGLLAHGASVFLPDFFLGKNWEEKKIRELMEKQKNQKP